MNGENLSKIIYPICPISMFFEGDEDKCDVSKCDFDIDFRMCSQGCRINVAEFVELEVIASENKPGTYGIFPVGCSDNTRALAECSGPGGLDFAKELVHRSNNFYHLLEMCRGNRMYLQQMKPLFESKSGPEYEEMIRILDKIDGVSEKVITQAIERNPNEPNWPIQNS